MSSPRMFNGFYVRRQLGYGNFSWPVTVIGVITAVVLVIVSLIVQNLLVIAALAGVAYLILRPFITVKDGRNAAETFLLKRLFRFREIKGEDQWR